ncbi:hypothetical protein PR003_g30325 [Phytophthora rubi]|uniref:RxLR effector protein n=1 Tax=Phytophthora rubi TaxID=129364 RepID=A0A6A4BB23_9STRA|nr:hypothetical protein PR002_g31531 [Phytophthora rubi]KAE9272038.1 hypothetical protein PR003_g30325 [Phytophthora rubi]
MHGLGAVAKGCPMFCIPFATLAFVSSISVAWSTASSSVSGSRCFTSCRTVKLKHL